ncbi:carbohydrate binding protein with CBM9 domain [Arcicella aurantiaca]|uniref:Carbohydrate binding protein with CBM9 domain n=1 Tax=Arcicella aurantiaca TaxID=591202 RepID=A0A316EBK1_9BACT|nr:DUF5916 domain-containing protein [Arcicella aurantiaca]PWK26153.1 carbohydrate binding protein with CBM9 domain [Arcicella aurantiaca]
MKSFILTSIFLLGSLTFYAQKESKDTLNIPKKQYFTQKLTVPIRLDGIIDDKAWDDVQWAGDFLQYQPNEGKAPSQPTSFKILYDDKFLYVAYRCHDSAPDSVVKRMSRRDQFPGDFVEINIDSYHDLRTAFSFTISVSGVRGDEFISNNGNNWDDSWNPIWFAKTHTDNKGWTAEVKIPLSQLRFGNEPDKVWGIQVTRRIFRKEERSTWQKIPQNSGVWVSGFGELHGLKDVRPQKQVEIAPYTVAKTEGYKPEVGNPFATGRDSKMTFGVDGKVAVTSDLILDFTVNPDFGQVEADPSQVRIDGFQNFFEERRPFFIESRNIFDYQLTGSEAGDDYDSDLLFYSRRIGGSPHGYPNLKDGEFAQVPQNTSILGAAKFSGKTKNGWSIGLLESVTQEVSAVIDNSGSRRTEVIEPLTNYFVSRLQKDFKGGQTVIGGIFTGVNRDNNLNNSLHTGAYSGGFDFLHYWKNRTWYLRGNLVFSHVLGSKQKIYETQTAFEHLFQRTNATEVSLDSTRTSLTGTGGTFRIGKSGGKSGKLGQVFKFETGVTYRSPELEVNDIGFMLTANEINHFTWAGLHFQKQVGIFRNARINYNHFSRWDFGGQFLYQAFNTNMHGNFKNNWRVGTGTTWMPYLISNTALRGGSSLRMPAGINHWAYVQSDTRKKINVGFEMFNYWGAEETSRQSNYSLSVRAQPLDAMTVSLGVGINHNWKKQDQFVSSTDFNGKQRIVVSEVDQNTLRYTLRLNYNITPDLTLQYYGQPFITRPTYKNFGYVVDPLNQSYDARFHRFNNEEIAFRNGSYEVDENRDGKVDYTFGKPDFNFVQFRSNLVARWEYKAGSEFYLVWSQGNTPDASTDFDSTVGTSLFNNIFAGQARNIFLMKFTYRFLK